MKRSRMLKKADVPAYRQIWRIVDGAVADAFAMHPEYLTVKGQRVARLSIVKRVVGAIESYVEQSTQGRSGEKPAAEMGEAWEIAAPSRRSAKGAEAVFCLGQSTAGALEGAGSPARFSSCGG